MNRRRHSRLKRKLLRNGKIAGAVVVPILLIAWSASALTTPERPEIELDPVGTPEVVEDTITRVEGWIPYWGDPAGTARAAVEAGFTDLLFFGATLQDNGKIKLDRPSHMNQAVDVAHKGGLESWLTVTNHGKSLAKVLTAANREKLAEQMVSALKASGCKHLDLDLESLSGAQWAELPELAKALRKKLEVEVRLSMTLQPADSRLRPWAVKHVESMLADPGISAVRFMCYDYHWRTSLPGALYSRPAFERLLDCYRGHEKKLSMALPLYGYDWPRPENVSVPAAKTITISELPEFTALAGAKVKWLEKEGELAVIYEDGDMPRMAAVPSLRTIADRAEIARARGLEAVAFWHLGCGRLQDVREAVTAQGEWEGDPDAIPVPSWANVLDPYKRENCRTVVARQDDSFAKLSKEHRVSASSLYLFNEHLTDSTLPGRTIYLPLPRGVGE